MFAIVVEDCPIVRSALLKFLDRRGIRAVGCANCHQAISAIDERNPDLLVCDWDIGKGGSGVTVVSHLRQRSDRSRVIMITGRAIDRLKENTTNLKVDAYLKKPFSIDQLSRAVNTESAMPSHD